MRQSRKQLFIIPRLFEAASPWSRIAVMAVGNWDGMAEEVEKAGYIPLLTNAGKAKAMMRQIN